MFSFLGFLIDWITSIYGFTLPIFLYSYRVAWNFHFKHRTYTHELDGVMQDWFYIDWRFSKNHKKIEIVFIKNKCLPHLPKLAVLQQNPPIFNVLVKLEEKAWAVK
jgi:hypothetical protein